MTLEPKPLMKIFSVSKGFLKIDFILDSIKLSLAIPYIFLILLLSCKERNINTILSHQFTDHKGNPFQFSSLKGKKTILYFGYSHCPDMCPLALSTLSKALLEMKEKNIYGIFVTLDPERDNPIRMSGYVSGLRNDFLIGITGQLSDIKDLASAFAVQSKRKDENMTYYIDHTNQLIFLDENFSIVGRYPANLSFTALIAEISKYK